MNVRLITVTPDAEAVMVYIARVSNPANQDNPDFARLIRYCIRHEHWSVFEHAYMTLEITTMLAIAAQLTRHRSFTFQQFSQRYAEADLPNESFRLRTQGTGNRQGSGEPIIGTGMPVMVMTHALDQARAAYRRLLDMGVAREVARLVLPQATATRLYMTGNVRSWIHYIALRTKPDTQLEHREVAEACRAIFCEQFPTTAAALGWTEAAD